MKDINFIDAIKSLGFDGVCSFSDVPTSQSDVDTMFRKQVGTDETDTAIMEVGNCPFTYDELEAERQRLQDLEDAKHDRLKTHPGIHLFVGQTFPTEPRLYEYQLDDYADIQKLDFSWLSTGEEGSLKHLREEPLFLVCSNGRRDKCCARYGPAIYQELVEEAGDSVWQSSHIGGHNQTPIMLFFPHGVNYARTTPAEARSLVREYQHGRLVLNHYRGRVGIEPHVQAAEHFWRKSTGVLDLPGMRVESFSQVSEDQWDVKIVGTIGDSSKPIQVERRKTDFSIPITCSKKKQSLIVSYHQVNNK